jgi:FtsH-binding integral membrane protein
MLWHQERMDRFTKDSREHLFRSLFFICEAAFVTSFTLIEVQWLMSPNTDPGAISVLIFWISLVALLIVCFCLRRKARRLAVIGWITAFILFWWVLLTPEL